MKIFICILDYRILIEMKFVFLLTIPLLFNSQKIKIMDSINNNPIPHAKIISNNNLYLTDSLGVYNFESIPKEEITITASGYESKLTKLNSNSIKLNPKIIPIDEVKISNKKLGIQHTIGYKNGSPTTFISENLEYAIEIKNDYEFLCKVDEIEIPFKKAKNKKGYLLIDLYESHNAEIGEILNSTNYTIPISTLGKNKFVKIKDNIYIDKNQSIYIAITWIESTYEHSENFSNKIDFFSLPKGSIGKMFVRRTTYKKWDTTPLIENKETKFNFIPAFRIHTKCER